MKQIRIVLTGGGSSGHISPALAIISTLREMSAEPGCDWNAEFLYIGGKLGLERELVEAQGVRFASIETGKLRRYFSARNFSDALRIPVGATQAYKVLRRYKPQVVVSTGGYVGVPTVLAARALHIPTLIHEQTVQIGLANRISAHCAALIAVGWESARSELSVAQRSKTRVTGNPVRPIVFGGSSAAGAAFAGFDGESAELPVVYVTGGSQGARVINRAIESVLPRMLSVCRVIHQCGRQPEGQEQDFDRLARVAGTLPPALRQRYFVTPFINDEIKDVYALADLVVGRAGAGTVSELCALGKAALYIPLVPTGGDEQARNAQMCVNAGAATVLDQTNLTGGALFDSIHQLLVEPDRLAAMKRAALTLARPDAARELAQCVLELVP